MLRRTETLKGYTIRASDMDAGTVDDFYFSDDTWSVRYIVVDTGPWLVGRRVLMSPMAFEPPTIGEVVLRTYLTREQVENSPDIDLDRPVSRQNELALHDYYGWPYYWLAVPGPMGPGAGGGAVPMALPANVEPERSQEQAAVAEAQEAVDPCLRSISEVTGYHIEATDGAIGHVEDFVIDDEGWIIRYLLVDTRNWLPGRKVLVSPDWIERVSWDKSKVYADLTRQQVEDSPEYDPALPLNRGYEERLYRHYDVPNYWP